MARSFFSLVLPILASCVCANLRQEPRALEDLESFAKFLTNKEKLLALQEKELELKSQSLKLLESQISHRERALQEQAPIETGIAVNRAEPTLIFFDDFKSFNLSLWKHEITMSGGGNWEFQYYINNRTNSFVEDGILNILPTLTADRIGEEELTGVKPFTMDIWGASSADVCTSNAFYGCIRASGGGRIINPVQSARIRTAGSFSFRYGRVEVKAKLPKGDWIWPAIWLLPEEQLYGAWPASGEIDIMESRGNAASYAPGGVNTFSSTLHWGPFYPQDPYEKTQGTYTLPENEDFSQDFHIFGLYWDEEVLYTYLDKDEDRVLEVKVNESFWEKGGWEGLGLSNPWRGQRNVAPFDQKFHLIINVAVGGTNGYFPDGFGAKPWDNKSPDAASQFWQMKDQWYPTWLSPAMQVDWVKVWSLE